jgi:fluoride ion exporter CrcB/FEX
VFLFAGHCWHHTAQLVHFCNQRLNIIDWHCVAQGIQAGNFVVNGLGALLMQCLLAFQYRSDVLDNRFTLMWRVSVCRGFERLSGRITRATAQML